MGPRAWNLILFMCVRLSLSREVMKVESFPRNGHSQFVFHAFWWRSALVVKSKIAQQNIIKLYDHIQGACWRRKMLKLNSNVQLLTEKHAQIYNYSFQNAKKNQTHLANAFLKSIWKGDWLCSSSAQGYALRWISSCYCKLICHLDIQNLKSGTKT